MATDATCTSFSPALTALGKFELRIDDRVAPPIPTQKARALLAYLIGNRERDVSRERLLELFWNDAEPERAREGLRTALSSIRRALRDARSGSEELLYSDKSIVRWTASTEYDADRFQTLAAREDPSSQREALDAYGGDFLEGNYEDWAANERERLASVYEDLLARVVRRTRDPADARVLLERNPYDEAAYEALIEAEARANRPAAARELLAKYRAAAAELGTAPSPELEQHLLAAADQSAFAENSAPKPLSSFVGRSDEIATLKTLVERARLTTIVGPGGIGKTRLALAVAAEVAPAFADGVSFVDLAAVEDHAYLGTSIATAVLGTLPASLTRPALEILTARLANRALLLLVDNCEHLMPEVASAIETVLAGAQRVVALATSREPLGIDGEEVVRLSALEELDAIALFTERARARDKSFHIDDDDFAVVAAICRRLDGIPLAIELAASRVNVLSLKALRAKLDERLNILTSPSSTALPRHKTVQALIDWSYDLLSGAERKLLRIAATFTSGFTLEGVTAIFDEDVSEADVLELLSSLVAKSLVLYAPSGGIDRYSMLQTTREYALEKLRENDDINAVRKRHVQYFLRFAREADANYATWNAREWVLRYPTEFESIRAALDYCFESGDATNAAALTAASREFYQELGLHAEGIRGAERALDALDDETPLELRAGLWLVIAQLGNTLYHTDRALSNARRAHEAFEKLDDRYHALFSKQTLAFALMRSGSRDEAEELFARVQSLAKQSGNQRVLLRSLLRRAENQQYLSTPSTWLPLFERALQLAKTLSDNLYTGYILGHMSEAHFMLGDVSEAIAGALAAQRIFQQRKDVAKEANILANLAAYHIAIDDLDSAQTFAARAIDLAREAEDIITAINASLHLGTVAAIRGDAGDAARLIGFALAAHARNHGGTSEFAENHSRDAAIEALRLRLDLAELRALQAEGAALSDDEGLALAQNSTT